MIYADERSSFAYFTVHERLPAIGRIAADRLKDLPGAFESIRQLMADIRSNNKIDRKFFRNATDFTKSTISQNSELSWLRLPFFKIESLFYSAINSIANYEKNKIDPFDEIKLSSHNDAIRQLNNSKDTDFDATGNILDLLYVLMTQAIIGNEFDYSSMKFLRKSQTPHSTSSDRIIINEMNYFCKKIIKRELKIAYILDNVGPELLYDLILIDFMLSRELARSITIFPKKQPMFVSDATMGDIAEFLAALKCSAGPGVDLADSINSAINNGALSVEIHADWNDPRHFSNLTASLVECLNIHDLIITKGDLNYRRFLEDRRWPLGQDARLATENVPFESLCLRSLKSECLVGVPEQVALTARMARESWLTDGYFGIAQMMGNRHEIKNI